MHELPTLHIHAKYPLPTWQLIFYINVQRDLIDINILSRCIITIIVYMIWSEHKERVISTIEAESSSLCYYVSNMFPLDIMRSLFSREITKDIPN